MYSNVAQLTKNNMLLPIVQLPRIKKGHNSSSLLSGVLLFKARKKLHASGVKWAILFLIHLLDNPKPTPF